jgi:hypothetical protein
LSAGPSAEPSAEPLQAVPVPVPAPVLVPVPEPVLAPVSDSVSDSMAEPGSESASGPVLAPASEPEIVLVDGVESLLEQARARVVQTMLPPPRAGSPVAEELAPEPERDRANESPRPGTSANRRPRLTTVEREAMALPLQPAYDLLEIQPEPAVPEALGHLALRGSSPTISDGEVSQHLRRTGRRRRLWPLAAIGCVGGLAAAFFMFAPQEHALSAIAPQERPLHERARPERTLQKRPATLVSAATGPAGNPVIPAVTAPVEPAPAPDPGLEEIDELLRQAERALDERDWDAAWVRLDEARAHHGYARIDPERAARVDDLTSRIEADASQAMVERVDTATGAVVQGHAGRCAARLPAWPSRPCDLALP